MKKIVNLVGLAFLILVVSCSSISSSGSFKYNGKIFSGKWLRGLKIYITKKNYIPLQIYFPKNYKSGDSLRTIFLLHGIDGNLRDWEKNTAIESMADKYNFILVSPNMKNSLYETKFYSDVSYRWNKIPGGEFFIKFLVPYVRDNFNIATKKESSGIFGGSSGARGALLISSLYSNQFGAVAGFSGYYDLTSITKDSRVRSVYGKYKNNKLRWENDDNIMKLAVNLKDIPVFLSHGSNDYIVPSGQSLILAMKLKMLHKKFNGYDITYIEKKHSLQDWKFWRKVLPNAMDFFNNI